MLITIIRSVLKPFPIAKDRLLPSVGKISGEIGTTAGTRTSSKPTPLMGEVGGAIDKLNQLLPSSGGNQGRRNRSLDTPHISGSDAGNPLKFKIDFSLRGLHRGSINGPHFPPPCRKLTPMYHRKALTIAYPKPNAHPPKAQLCHTPHDEAATKTTPLPTPTLFAVTDSAKARAGK